MKKLAIANILVLIATISLSFHTYNLQTSQHLSAKSLTIVDEWGNVKAFLGKGKHGVDDYSLILIGENKEILFNLSLLKRGPQLKLNAPSLIDADESNRKHTSSIKMSSVSVEELGITGSKIELLRRSYTGENTTESFKHFEIDSGFDSGSITLINSKESKMAVLSPDVEGVIRDDFQSPQSQENK